MPVKFIAIQKKNPQKPAEPGKWYPKSVSDGEVKLSDLAKYASETSTVSKADILAVLETVFTKVSSELAEGKIVRVGEYFSLQVSISGEGADKEEDVNASKIKSNKILFRPGKMLSDMLKVVTYKKGS